MKRVLVTGASGFIGRNALQALIGLGYDVVAVSSRMPLVSNEKITVVTADLLNPAEVTQVISQVQPTHLLHFAWYVEHGRFWSSPENIRWVQASTHLLQEFAANGGMRVVSAGTCAEYDWSRGYCIENETPLLPATIYGECKSAMRGLQTALCKTAGISQAWGRMFLLYGPNEHPGRLVSSVIHSLKDGQPARCSHGEQIRDLMYVQDVAEAFVALLDSKVEGSVNIGSGHAIALKEMITSIGSLMRRPDLIRLGEIPPSLNDPPLLLPDVRILLEEVGWRPKVDLETGLERTIRWWEENA